MHRNDTATAIQQCKEAGIKVFMITGDHPTAASALASQIGLIASKDEVNIIYSKNYFISNFESKKFYRFKGLKN